MLPDWILVVLKDNGVAGAIIFVLLSTIGGLVAVVRGLYKHNQRVYGFRLAERDSLNKALNDSSAAINAMRVVTDDRNKVTDELSNAFKLLAQRVELNHIVLKEELSRNGSAISTAADVYAKTVNDIRLFLMAQGRL